MTWLFRLWLCAFVVWNIYSLVEQNIYRADLLATRPQLGDLSLSLLSAMNLVAVIAGLLLFNWRRSGVVLAILVHIVVMVVHLNTGAQSVQIVFWVSFLVVFGVLVRLTRTSFDTSFRR